MDIGVIAAVVSAAASVIGISIQIWMIARQSMAAQAKNHGVSVWPACALFAVGVFTIASSVAAGDWHVAVPFAALGAVACSTGLFMWFIVHLHRGVLRLLDNRINRIERKESRLNDCHD